ncbi:MAG: hypothetical protein ACR2PI_13110 [Hyphomicrobiaceae bacterium]
MALTGSGATIRIDGQRNNPEKFVIFFHSRTGLLDQFRTIYGDQLAFIGNPAIEPDVGEAIPVPALTHHLRNGQ